MDDVTLIIGLGNPGREHSATRHNVGFRTVDHLAHSLALSFSRQRFEAFVAGGNHFGRKVILAKPQTYMNLSGGSVAALVRFFHVPFENLLVCADDIDLPLGTLRLRPFGGSGGHRGLRRPAEVHRNSRRPSEGFSGTRFQRRRDAGRKRRKNICGHL